MIRDKINKIKPIKKLLLFIRIIFYVVPNSIGTTINNNILIIGNGSFKAFFK